MAVPSMKGWLLCDNSSIDDIISIAFITLSAISFPFLAFFTNFCWGLTKGAVCLTVSHLSGFFRSVQLCSTLFSSGSFQVCQTTPSYVITSINRSIFGSTTIMQFILFQLVGMQQNNRRRRDSVLLSSLRSLIIC